MDNGKANFVLTSLVKIKGTGAIRIIFEFEV